VTVRKEVREIVYGLVGELVRKLKAAAAIDHPGESGTAREGAIKEFLEKLIPSRFSVGDGFAFDALGDISKQLDVVIVRNDYHPVFRVGGVNHYPIESVAAVIQSRASVAARASLLDALENLESVKALDRTASGANYQVHGTIHGGPVHPDEFQSQVWTAVLTQASLARGTWASEMKSWLSNSPRRLWPNMYVDVNGFSTWYGQADEKVSTNPMHAVNLRVSDVTRGDERMEPPLADFAFSLLSYLRTAHLIDFQPELYLPISTASAEAMALN
jgi:uncharacterized protein DUF6602